MLERMEHPDTTLKYDPADKSFSGRSALGSKEAVVRPFAFSHPATLGKGDFSLQTYRFGDKDKFRTNGFDTKADRASRSDAFTQKDRGFATKALPVQDAPGAGKTAPYARDYVPGLKGIVIRGKRQEAIDEIHNQKELSIDEVREILNKPNGRPGSRPAVEALPVTRAMPVPAPTAP